MPRPRTHDEATREALVDAAGELLAKHGSDALSLRRVAEQVGASTQVIYTLFGSKEGLIRAMFRQGFESLDRHLGSVPITGDPVRDLRDLGLAYRASARAHPHLYDIMFACPFPEFEPSEDDHVLIASTLERPKAMLQHYVERGDLSGIDPEDVCFQLWALAHGLATLELQYSLGPPEHAERHWRQAFEAIVRGYLAQSRRGS
jgi:AcrR family transcriptional regulator